MQAYLKKIHADKRQRGVSVYHAAIKAFMKKHSRKVSASEVKITLQKCRDTYQLTDRQEKGIRHLIAQGRLTNAIYQQLNNISKATATRDLQDLCRQGAVTSQSRGAGACYRLVSLPNEEEGDDPEEEIILI